MARHARVVEHLRLRGESESAVRHAVPALEDAFRTASLPDAGARIVCVRRLQLGRLPSNGSPQNMALLIEKRFTEADWKVVHASEGGADAAEAVWFRDAFEAHETAALRIAAGQMLDAWFWPLALPGIVTEMDGGNLRTIAFAIAAMEEAARALPAWTASLVRAGYRQQLIAALRPGDGHALLRAAGIASLPYARSGSVPAHETRAPRKHVDDRATFVDVTASRTGGQLPQRSTPIAERPSTRATQSADAIAAAPESAARAARGQPPLRQLATPSERGSDQRFEPPSNQLMRGAKAQWETARDQFMEGAVPDAVGDRREERRTASPPGAPPGQRAAAVNRSVRAEGGSRDQAADAPVAFTSPWQLPSAAPTAAGGLLFLLPVLERIGFADWSAARGPKEPEPEVLAAQILHLLLSRLHVEEDDPIWGIAAPEGSGAAASWLTRCRRYLRRHVRIGLASLVIRRARVAITPTHVDIFFRLNAADVRVRRAGLDIDPGWIQWFGRVVTFHYEDRPWN